MQRRILMAAIVLGGLAAPIARAGERVTLRNGFELRCDHHTEAEGRVRLYVNASEDSFIEFAPQEIAAVEAVADLPPSIARDQESKDVPLTPSQATPTKATESKATPTNAAPGAQPDARLSPADLHEILSKAGSAHHLDVDLLASLVKAESGGNAHAVSRAGARGLMQLMPGTAADLGVQDSFRPDENVSGGSAYLDQLLTRYHEQLAMALAAYNAGPAAVDKYNGIPPYRETRAYVARVIHEFNRRVRLREAQSRRDLAAVAHSNGTR